MTSYIERTPNLTLLLTAVLDFGDGPFEDCIVIQVEDRLGQIITPDPEATEEMQQRIDDRLQHYSTKRRLDNDIHVLPLQSGDCTHGLPKFVCTICQQPGGDYA
ncbi:hypothetical protein LCGC14_0491150 [marine sediment metagenome]|uniref:Uncharacterized protein n=1 Tax=marine sediment metagenome TaxID=412755 RepID=A0A0F9SPY1_9ZZZZ